MTTNSTASYGVLTNVLTLGKIFNNLSARQLNTCARVCKLWNSEALKEKSSRRQIRWNSFSVDGEFEDVSRRDEWWKNINSFIWECPFEPVAALMFASESLYAEFESYAAPNKKTKKQLREKTERIHVLFPSALPSHCKLHISVTDGIIGTDQGMKTEEYDECEMAMSIILFGEHCGMQLIPFSCSHDDCQAMLKCWAEKLSDIPSCLHRLKKTEVKMVNLFCPMNGIDHEIGYSLFRMFDWPLVAGGNVNSRFLKDGERRWLSSSSSCLVTGVALCGQNIKVASVLMRSDVDTEEKVDAIIKNLSKHEFPLHRSFGFMYACVGRGSHIYNGKHNVESKVFRKYFPKTPLFGFFGNGEIGCTHPQVDPFFQDPANSNNDSISSESKTVDNGDEYLSRAQIKRQIEEMKRKEREYKMKHPPKLMHAYTTVMCLVSLVKER